MRYTLLCCIIILLSVDPARAQNLVPNPSFEKKDSCPPNSGYVYFPGTPSFVSDWYRPTRGSTDYFNSCSSSGSGNVGVPQNFAGYMEARTGNAYMGGHMFIMDNRDYREYIQARLTTPLLAAHQYHVSFWVARSRHYKGFVIDQMGAYLGTGYVVRNIVGPLFDLIPQIANPTGNFLRDTAQWMQISGVYTASGGEDNIVIGNFPRSVNVNVERIGPSDNAYYYIDDVCVFDITHAVTRHDTAICTENVNLTLSGKADFDHYIWNTGDTTKDIRVSQGGTFWVRSYSDCGWNIDTFLIHHDAIPDFSIGKDTTICDGSSLLLQPDHYLPVFVCEWQDGQRSTEYTAKKSGIYTAKIFNEYCAKSDSVSVVIKNFSQDLGDDIIKCKGSREEIILRANVPEGAEVVWSNGSTDSSVAVTDSGFYWVSVMDFLCQGSDTMYISYEICDCEVRLPNAFSPNQDGHNDVFYPVLPSDCRQSILQYQLNIFNRFGQRVFSSANPEEGWNGLYGQKPVDAGTYFYEIRYTAGTGNHIHYHKGDVILIR